MKQMKRRFITLIEIMIVMFLIALITGVLAYNYRGSLDEGKAFKTKAGIEKLETILNMRVAENPDLLNNISNEWEGIVEGSRLVKDSKSLVNDGWGKKYSVTVKQNGDIEVKSAKYDEYIDKNKGTMFGK